jgi:O-antigen/teichoic acid export membrane protein
MSNTIGKLEISKTPYPPSDGRDIVIAAKGGGIIFVGTLFEYVSRFVLGIVVARFVGAAQYGVYNLALTPLNILSMFALLGLKAAMVRYVPIYVHQRDEESLWGTLQVGLGLVMFTSIVLGIGLFILAEPVADIIFHTPELTPFLRIAGLIVPFTALIEIMTSATQGLKEMQYSVYAREISMTSIKLVLTVTFLVLGFRTLGIMIAHAVATLAAFVMLLYFLHKLFPLRRPIRAARRNTRQMLGLSLPIYFSQVVDVVGGNLSVLLLGMLNTTTGVGIFAAAQRVSMTGRLFHSSIVLVSQPIVSDLYSKGDWAQLRRFYQVMTKWTFTFNLPLFLAITVFSGPILSIFGSSFVAGSAALAIMAFGFLISAGTGICGVVINMSDNTQLNLLNSVLAVVLTLVFNIWLVPSFGVLGAAIASTSAGAVINVARLLEVFLLFRILPYNRDFIKPVIAGLAAIAVTLSAKQWVLPETGLVPLALGGILLLITYIAVILLLGLSEEDQMVLKRLHSRLKIMLKL